MSLCSDCTEFTVPMCIDTIYLNAYLDGGNTYIVEFENEWGKKHVLVKVGSNYTGEIDIDLTTDLPDGYLFKGKSYTIKIYESTEDYLCGNNIPLCPYGDCWQINVEDIVWEETDITLECC